MSKYRILEPKLENARVLRDGGDKVMSRLLFSVPVASVQHTPPTHWENGT